MGHLWEGLQMPHYFFIILYSKYCIGFYIDTDIMVGTPPPPLLIRRGGGSGGRIFQKLSHLGWGARNLLGRGDKPEKGELI